jgi:hypothetical protein
LIQYPLVIADGQYKNERITKTKGTGTFSGGGIPFLDKQRVSLHIHRISAEAIKTLDE